jgi:hypothetical protein
MNEEYDKKMKINEPRAHAKERKQHVLEITLQTKEHVQVEDVTGAPYSNVEEEEDAHQKEGSSIVIEKRKGKQPIWMSPHKQEEVTISLSRIPERVTILPTILGCV